MNPRIQFLAIASSVAAILFVFHLIRARKLREEYALFWFGCSLAMLIVSFWRHSIDLAAHLAGVRYSPSLLFLVVIAIAFYVGMHYSISLSRLEEHQTKMAQELALLRFKLEERTHSSDTHDAEG
jgi:hypothetical protein